MTTITLSSPTFYKAGDSGVSRVVGYESKCNRVARYAFVTPAAGASSVSLTFSNMDFGNGTKPETLRFYIGTEADSHVNGGADSDYTGILQAHAGSSIEYTDFSGTAEIILLPDTAYYLFVFPDSTTWGWYYWDGNASLAVSGGSCSFPSVSASSVEMGKPLTIFTNRNAGFTHTLVYSFGRATGTIATGVGDSYEWVPDTELARQIPNAVNGTAVITCTTFQEDTQIGEPQSVTATLTVPDTVIPAAEATWTDSSGAADALGVFVQGVSRLAVSVTGSGAYGSNLTSAAVTLDGKAYSGGVITGSGDLPLVVTVTDSRGRSGSSYYTITVEPYTKPSVTLDASRCNEEGIADDTGEFARVTITGSTTQVGSNIAALSFTYGTTTDDITVGLGEFTHTQTIPADSTKILKLSVTLSDRLLNADRDMILSVGYATMDFLKGGKGVAFGATATKEGFTCAMDMDLCGKTISNLAEPAVDSDAATKKYVDEHSGQDLTVQSPLKLQNGQLELCLDPTVTAESALPVTSGAVYNAIAETARGSAQRFSFNAGTNVDISISEGDMMAFTYVTNELSAGDIFLKANGASPHAAYYTFNESSSKFTGGIITYGGSIFYASFNGFAQLLDGRLHVWGMGLRGNGTGFGWAHLTWTETELGSADVSSFAFTKAGTLIIRKL